MPPLYQTATFQQPGPTENGEYDYNRSGNPTRTVLERQMADLEVRLYEARLPPKRSCLPSASSLYARKCIIWLCCYSLPQHSIVSRRTCICTSSTPPLPFPSLFQGADRAFAFASGMAALSAVTRLVKAGEHIVAGDDLYGGTSRLLSRVVPDFDVSVTNVDTTNLE